MKPCNVRCLHHLFGEVALFPAPMIAFVLLPEQPEGIVAAADKQSREYHSILFNAVPFPRHPTTRVAAPTITNPTNNNLNVCQINNGDGDTKTIELFASSDSKRRVWKNGSSRRIDGG